MIFGSRMGEPVSTAMRRDGAIGAEELGFQAARAFAALFQHFAKRMRPAMRA